MANSSPRTPETRINGGVGRGLTRDIERAQTIKLGQGVVGEDDVEVFPLQGLDEGSAGIDPVEVGLNPTAAQAGRSEVRVDGAVFEQEDANRFGVGHRNGYAVSRFFMLGRRLPGGGSLTTAQKMPRSRTASMNS